MKGNATVTDPDTLPTTIDELMAIDPLELSKRSAKAYDKYVLGVIAYHRNARAAREAGTKAKTKTTTHVTNDALKSLLAKAKAARPKSPLGTGIRRI